MTSPYDDAYFEAQRANGELVARTGSFRFAPYVGPSDTVLDFGCGGGYMLAALACGRRIGVDPNAAARRSADLFGVETYARLQDVPEESIDVAISHHALEHVECPLHALQQLRAMVARGGRLVVIVPHQTRHEDYRADDQNHHLYTWNRQTLGNLVRTAGFEVERVENLSLAIDPRLARLSAVPAVGPWLFIAASRLLAHAARRYDVRCVAHVP